MRFRVGGVVVEAEYNKYYNSWFAKVYDDTTCYYTCRRLRAGMYDFFNGIVADISYGSKKPENGDCIDDAELNFTAPCQLVNIRRLPCG